jgi:tetratricopeptide (TPR) repeat protein
MSAEQSRVHNEIHGGVHGGTVIQGRDITYHAPRPKPESLRGLPRLSPVFTGRDADVEALLESLNPASAGQRRSPTVVISGMPGSGKTELALHTAKQALDQRRWCDGVLYVDLFGYDPQRRVDPGRALGGWLLNLGVDAQDIPADAQAREQMYRAELSSRAERGRPVLVIVDNASSAEQAEPLLPGDGRSGALVTSRHVLDLGARVHRLGELDDESAVEVIRRSLWELWGDSDTRVSDEPDGALRLARLCGRLPLALRIVAGLLADVSTWTLAQMADDFHKKRLDGLEREEWAVRAAFDLSYQNLASRQAELFRLVALAPGTDVSTESAAVLIEAEETEARRLLTALARASLVDPVGADRWRLHDLVRIYAGERAGGSGREGAGAPALRRLLTHLMLTADAADDSLRTLPGEKVLPRFVEEEAALAWLDGEQETLVAAVQVARGLHETTCAVNLPLILAHFLRSRMRLAELLEIAEVGCRTAEGTGRRGDAAKLWAEVGETLVLMRRFRQAAEAHDKAFAHAVAAEDWHSAAGVLNSGGVALRCLGNYEEALSRHTEAVLIFERLGDQTGVAKASNNKANVFLATGRPDEAVIHQRVAMEIYAKRGDGQGFARSCLNMGNSYSALGTHDLAVTSFQWACDHSRDGGEPRILAMATAGLAVSLYRTGLSDKGSRAFEEAIRLFRELGDLYDEARTWRNFGVALRGEGRLKEAERVFRKGLDAFAECGDPCGEGDCWNGISGTLISRGQYEDALPAARRSTECHEGLAVSECAATSWNNLGFILSELGRVEEAIPALRRSRDTRVAQGNLGRAAQISRTMGFKLVETDRFGMAVEAFREAARLFTEVGDDESADQVRELTAECAALLDETGE